MTARILVVDDVAANIKLLEARLSAEYFDVTTASNGAEALAICARAECDIVLLDVMMPDIDGFEVCRRLKSNPATHYIPVLMVTALDSPEAVGHHPVPDFAGSAVLGHLFEEIIMRVEEERDARRELINFESRVDGRFDVSDGVGDGKRQLLDCGRAGFANVIAAD